VIRVGCSGWSYDDWDDFYEGVSREDRLSHYAGTFDTVEVNSTFYEGVDADTIRNWCDAVPERFRFSVKAHRVVTHMRKLADVEESLGIFLETVEAFGHRLGALLFQVPGNLHRDDERLEAFCGLLPRDRRCVLEFRHESWWCDPVYDILEDHGVALCGVSAPRLPREIRATADFGYVRMHGTSRWYEHRYGKGQLRPWLARLERLPDPVFVYFNNDVRGFAPRDAQTLAALLEERG